MARRPTGRRGSKRLLEQTRADYAAVRPKADRLLDCLRVQLTAILERHQIPLGVPMEARVKTLGSIEQKLTAKSAPAKSLADLTDLVGLRLILLFRRDLTRLDEIIRATFSVDSFENTADRLETNQFGYQSNHYLVRLPKTWLEIPSYADLGEQVAEIQIRTLAQHIWAAASHKLQYKREESVPPPLRRTIHRVSALLETVDLEFDRVLAERATYVEDSSAKSKGSNRLNVDLLAAVLSEMWPAENTSNDENYDELLNNLNDLGVITVDELRDILRRHRSVTLKREAERVASAESDEYKEDKMDRYKRGVFFTHVGLTRMALEEEFGRERVWTIMGFGDLLLVEE